MDSIQFSNSWEAIRFSALFSDNNLKNTDFSTSNALQFYFGRIIPKKKYELTNDLIETYRKYTLVNVGDIVINGLNLNYDFVSQRIGFVTESGIITSAYISLRPRIDFNVNYYVYLFKAMDAMKMFHGLGTGIRLTLSYADLKNILLPIPPRAEQDQIVRFLDWKVSAINRLIGIKRKEIDTVKALMYARIEKLLYQFPTVETKRLKQLGTFFKGGGFSRENLVDDKTYPAILYGDIYTQYEYQTATVSHHIDEQAYNSSRKIFKGDIVMAGTGETKDEIGKSILYLGEDVVAIGGDVIAFHPNEDVNVEYLLYQLYSQSALKHRYINGKGDIIVHIYPIALGNTVIQLPDKTAQSQIVAEIDETIHSVKKQIEYVTKSISVLQELKTRLIADTVTGKIDVRNIEIPEYEFVGEDSQVKEELDVEGSDNGE